MQATSQLHAAPPYIRIVKFSTERDLLYDHLELSIHVDQERVGVFGPVKLQHLLVHQTQALTQHCLHQDAASILELVIDEVEVILQELGTLL